MELLNQGQPFRTADAVALGLSRGNLRELASQGLIRRICRGVVVDQLASDTRELRLKAFGLIAPPEAIACNETAAWLWGVDTFKPSERFRFEPSFVVPHGTTRLRRSGVLNRQAKISNQDITFEEGVYLTTPLRTASDLLRHLYRPYALAAADGLARAALIAQQDLVEFVSRLKGYPGIIQARGLAVLVDGRAESPGESWQRLRIHDAGFPPPEVQYEVVDHFGRSRFLDLAYPEQLIGCEFDGREFHTDASDRQHDLDRREYLTKIFGYRWSIGTRQRLFGPDNSFENELGAMLGIIPRSRSWGNRAA